MSLSYISLNADAPSTVLLLHGLGSSHREWLPVAERLPKSYHLIIPDLPGHADSASIRPLTLDGCTSLLGDLVRAHAKDSACHIVGFSFGGYAALKFAERHPEPVKSVFVSGVYHMADSHWGSLTKLAPYVNTPINKLLGVLPQSLFNSVSGRMGMSFPEGLREDMAKNSSFGLFQEGFAAIAEFGAGREVRMRACAIAAAKHDDVQGVKELCLKLRGSGEGENNESRAFAIPGAVHFWALQFPDLFSSAVQAWIDGLEMPEELEDLSGGD